MEEAQPLPRRRLQVVPPLLLAVAPNPENHQVLHRLPHHHLFPTNKVTPGRLQGRDRTLLQREILARVSTRLGWALANPERGFSSCA